MYIFMYTHMYNIYTHVQHYTTLLLTCLEFSLFHLGKMSKDREYKYFQKKKKMCYLGFGACFMLLRVLLRIPG